MIKVLSLFSGIGAFEKALENLNVCHEVVNYCEIDKYASHAYSIIHNIDESYNLEDVTKININKLKDFDLLTHGSPCQSFSLAGRGEGGDEGSCTKSSLMWDTVNIVKNKMPKYIIWENVKAVTCKKHKHNFDKYLKTLKELGYCNYWKVLNGKNYGIPHHRERVFVVSIREDVNKGPFNFMKRKIYQAATMSDIVQDYVDEKYYFKDNYTKELEKYFELDLNKRKPNRSNILKLGDIQNPKSFNMNNRVFSKDGVSPTITTSSSNSPKIVECKIRRLTPLECWRLQGFEDNDYCKVRRSLENKFYNGKDISDTQMYKMAGNSIIVNILEDIFYELLIKQ